jgi:hypothetical protein
VAGRQGVFENAFCGKLDIKVNRRCAETLYRSRGCPRRVLQDPGNDFDMPTPGPIHRRNRRRRNVAVRRRFHFFTGWQIDP